MPNPGRFLLTVSVCPLAVECRCHELSIEMDVDMTSTRPYLLRALYQWIVDNDMTPYLLVDAEHKDVNVPSQYIEDGRIVMNISPSAVRELDLGNTGVLFSARFSGKPFAVSVPMAAVKAIYAQENGRGMVFSEDEPEDTPPMPPDSQPDKGSKPSLKLVK